MLESIFLLGFASSVLFKGVEITAGMSVAEPIYITTDYRGRDYYRSFSPEGEVEARTRPSKNVELFARHISSIPNVNDNFKNTANNSLGIRLVLKFDGIL